MSLLDVGSVNVRRRSGCGVSASDGRHRRTVLPRTSLLPGDLQVLRFARDVITLGLVGLVSGVDLS